MGIEKFRNNHIYESNLSAPLALMRSDKVDCKEDYLNQLTVIGDKLVGLCQPGYLFCEDLISGKLLWYLNADEEVDIPLDGDNEKIFLFLGGPTCLDANTGDIVWKSDSTDIILGMTTESLVCRDILEDESEVITCRSKENGEELWRLQNGAHNYLDVVSSDDGKVILKGGDGVHICNLETGAVLWESKFQKIIDKIRPGQKFFPSTAFGPAIDGIFYLGFNKIGVMAAFDIKTGEAIWLYDLKEGRRPDRIIHYQGKLYFNVFQVHGSENYLTCVDAKTGELIFKTEENFTPAGCKLPIITNNYFITATGKYLSFFDLEKEKFVWRKKQKKDLNGVYVYGNTLISCDIFKKEIYWFESK